MVTPKKTPSPENDGNYRIVTIITSPDRFIACNAPIPVVASKQEMLLFLLHHRIPKTRSTSEFIHHSDTPVINPTQVLSGLGDNIEDGFRRSTAQEAAAYFKIANDSTIRDWWKSRDKIFGGKTPKSIIPRWPALEDELVKIFTVARDENKIVTVH
jgi:hypothetical protein